MQTQNTQVAKTNNPGEGVTETQKESWGIQFSCKVCGHITRFPRTPNADVNRFEALAHAIYSHWANEGLCGDCMPLHRTKFVKNPEETNGFAACDFCKGGQQSLLNEEDETTYQNGRVTVCYYHYSLIMGEDIENGTN